MSRKTKFLELKLPDGNEFYDIEEDQNKNFEKIDEKMEEIENELTEYEKSFTKNTAFNKNFGTDSLEVLEGAKLAEILGVNYGGILNNSSTKTAGKAYYDTATKAVYLCKITNNLNYADLSKFEDFSNKGLLGKIENLSNTIRTSIKNSYKNSKVSLYGTFKFEKCGNTVVISYWGEFTKVSNDSLLGLTIHGIVPEEYRPREETSINSVTTYAPTGVEVFIRASGDIHFGSSSLNKSTTSKDWLMFSICYLI